MKKTRLLIVALCLCGVTMAQQNDEFKAYTSTIPGTTVTFTMTPIAAGSFTMGSPVTEKGRSTEEGPQRKVNIPAFWMGIHEVTHDEFQIFYSDESLSRNSDVDAVTRPTPQYIDFSLGMGKHGGFPFNSMSQHTALMYCRWLYKKTGVFYRLPTEAEWEYACRAGSTTAYPFGNDLHELGNYAWFAGNSGNKYHKTGEKKPNAWGLYDMLGNLAEWTLDQYHDNYLETLKNNSTDPFPEPTSKYPKTLKGGSYNTTADMMRSASRFKSDYSWNKSDPQIPKSKWWLTDQSAVGFRIVRPLVQPSQTDADAFYDKYLHK